MDISPFHPSEDDSDTDRDAMRRIWILGDVHGEFQHIKTALEATRLQKRQMPLWLIFVGDVELTEMSMQVALAPLYEAHKGVRVGFIHGNHDADTHQAWERLHDAGDAVHLHGRVVDMDGVRVAGLGGNFLDRVWSPPAAPKFSSRQVATYRHPNLVKRGQLHSPALNGAIYEDELDALAPEKADLLITHEAFSCHPYGWERLDQLAQDLGVVRAFHGHTHDDLTQMYRAHRERMGFEAVAVDFRCIKNGLGDLVFDFRAT